jgi:hypothetical protein
MFLNKNHLLFGLFLFVTGNIFSIEIDQKIVTSLLNKYPQTIYQDVIIHNQVVKTGTNICDVRFEKIKPVLESLHKPFSVLEIGAAQGYFSFRMAYEYPYAHCTMIERDGGYYTYHGGLLYDLCNINKLDNITFLKTDLTYKDLVFLNKKEHFDVVLAFLVVHQLAETLPEQIAFFNTILSLGDNVIIEVAAEVAVDMSNFIINLSEQCDCEYLGEVLRKHDSPDIGYLYWFKRGKKHSTKNTYKICKESFQRLNGVYPHENSSN